MGGNWSHLTPQPLRTVGTRALSSSGNWLMKHFRNPSTRLSSTGWDWVRHVCLHVCVCVSICMSVTDRSYQESCFCICVCVCMHRGACCLEKMAGCGTPCGHLHNFITSISLTRPAAYWYIDWADINVWLPLQAKFRSEEKLGWFKLHLGPEPGFLPVGRVFLILHVAIDDRVLPDVSFVWFFFYGDKVMLTSKRQENQAGACELWDWAVGVTEKIKAKVTAPRQCFWFPIKWAIHGFRTTSLWSQGDTPIEWGPGWPSLFVPSWPLLSRMASAPLTWPVPVHQ